MGAFPSLRFARRGLVHLQSGLNVHHCHGVLFAGGTTTAATIVLVQVRPGGWLRRGVVRAAQRVTVVRCVFPGGGKVAEDQVPHGCHQRERPIQFFGGAKFPGARVEREREAESS